MSWVEEDLSTLLSTLMGVVGAFHVDEKASPPLCRDFAHNREEVREVVTTSDKFGDAHHPLGIEIGGSGREILEK